MVHVKFKQFSWKLKYNYCDSTKFLGNRSVLEADSEKCFQFSRMYRAAKNVVLINAGTS